MKFCRGVFVVLAILTLPPDAGAQPRFDVFGGGHLSYRPPEPLTREWLVTGGYRINELFDLVVEVAWHQRRDLKPILSPDAQWGRSPADSWFQVATGIRGRPMRGRRFEPFYQGLIGLFSFSPTRPERRFLLFSPWNRSEYSPSILQPGVGLDVAVRPGFKVRVTGDLTMVRWLGHWHNLPRASVGIASQF